MRGIITAVILLAGLTFIPQPAKAQEHSDCFMVTEDGQLLDMIDLCGGPPRNRKPAPNRNTIKSGVFQARIKRRVSGIPVIDVKFNGQQTFEMMLDTGASNTVLTVNVARALKLRPEGAVLVDTASDTNVPLALTRVASITVGGIVARNVVVSVAPALDIGLLGQDFYGGFDVTIKKNVVEFRPRQPN